MSYRQFILKFVLISCILLLCVSGCSHYSFQPPYNNFKLPKYSFRAAFTMPRAKIIEKLKENHIQFEQYGDTMTLIVPTDRYFRFNSPRFNEVCYPGLMLIVALLRFYPNSVIYIAGFTDNVGSQYHKNMLTQAQAETMLTFLWGFGVSARLLNAEGYGDKHPVSFNKAIHGSAQNRRLEIQWFNPRFRKLESPIFMGASK